MDDTMSQLTYDYSGLLASTWDVWRDDTANWNDRFFFLDIVRQYGQPALDVGCGTGRIILDYLAEGIDIDGVDNSPEMLAVCQAKADKLGLAPRLYLQSIETLALPRTYRTILAPSSTLQLVVDVEAVRATLKHFFDHLQPGGAFVTSFAFAWREGDPLETDWELLFEKTRPNDGATVRSWTREWHEPAAHLWHGEQRFEVTVNGEVIATELHRRSPEGRTYTQAQAVQLFQEAGFTDVQTFHEFEHKPAQENDRLFCVLGVRPASVTTDASSQVELGIAHLLAGRYDDAMTAFEHALALDPKCADAWNGIGRVNYNIGTPEAAIAAYERAIAIDPHCDHAYYGIGILLSARLGKYEEAIVAFQRGVTANPDESYLQGAINSTYARMGHFETAIAAFQQSLVHNTSDTFALGWLSLMYLRQGRYGDAIDMCQREIAVEPSHSAHRALGFALDLSGRHDEAIAHLERAITLEPKDYEARGALARVYRAAGRLNDADEHRRIARAEAYADNEYGQACFESVSGNTEAALSLLKVGLDKQQAQPGWARIDPEFVFIGDDPRFKALVAESANEEVERGMTHFHAGRYDDAKAAFEHALALDPNCAPAWHRIGWLRERTSTAEAALEAYERAIDIDPRYDAPHYGIGMVHAFMRYDYDKALAAFQQGLEKSPDDVAFINQIGSTHALMGQFDEAIAMWQRALSLDPTSTHALGCSSEIYLRQKRFDETMAMCRREIAIKPTHSAHRLLGFALELSDRPDEAILQLEQAIALKSKDYEARAALARLYRTSGRVEEANDHERIAREDSTADKEYGLACVETVMRNADAALPLLKIAMEQHQARPGWIGIDPEFVFIDEDLRFKALMHSERAE